MDISKPFREGFCHASATAVPISAICSFGVLTNYFQKNSPVPPLQTGKPGVHSRSRTFRQPEVQTKNWRLSKVRKGLFESVESRSHSKILAWPPGHIPYPGYSTASTLTCPSSETISNLTSAGFFGKSLLHHKMRTWNCMRSMLQKL